MRAKPAAVLWDFDGTMVDTEPLWASTEQAMLGEHGIVWSDEQMLASHGQSARITARLMAEAAGEPEESHRWFTDLHDRISDHLRSTGLPWLPGARELMTEMEADGVPCAVVTASHRQIMDAAHRRMPRSMKFVITADDVTHTKPHPEGYLLAMERLGVRAADVVVLEDSRPGTQAALASGAFVYAVPSIATLDDHPRLHRAAAGLDQISWADLVDVWRAHKGI